ncbi:MAG: multiprotein bridging factor aMBF1 [Thermoplasmata archaeon]|nr:multiprotein bridging factor aMBF1 [Thermoplasmata archaeon]
MICEMCGKDVESLSQVRVEGSVLHLCSDCAKFGVVVAPPPSSAPVGRPASASLGPGPARFATPGRRMEERDLYKELPDMELAPDWAKRIRVAREKLTWTPEDLGKKLNEKKSVVLKIESGSFRPSDQMVRKIERLLRIRLRADPEPRS